MKIKIVLDKSNDQGYSCVFEHLTGWSVSEAVCYHPFAKKKQAILHHCTIIALILPLFLITSAYPHMAEAAVYPFFLETKHHFAQFENEDVISALPSDH